MRILVVEDEVAIRKVIETVFQLRNYDVTLVNTATDGITTARTEPFDCVVLDLGLPDGTGFQVLKSMRDSDNTTPVLILSAERDVELKVQGLVSGADDYLTKPFDNTELIARVEALIRRATTYNKKVDEVLTCGDITLNQLTRECHIGGKHVWLTNNEHNLLAYFMRNPNRMISKLELSEKVWAIPFDTHTNFVNVYISYLRKKIADYSSYNYIDTHRGKGFTFSGPS
jgi:DNA-binding response OmpR family regulator